MKRFLFSTDVKQVEGTQIIWVDAECAEEAMAMVNSGRGEIYVEELCVLDVGPFRFDGETDINDFGDFPIEIALPVLEQQGGWISCSERMPEETEIIGGDDFSPDVLTINQHGEQWVCCTHWGKWIHTKHSDCAITHWLRLPAEPHPSTTPQIDNDGWIEWNGGECPVNPTAIVEVKITLTNQGEGFANWWDWNHGEGENNIIAYRVIENDGREA